MSRQVWTAIAGVAMATISGTSAFAAAPAYCALYAREYMAQFSTGSSDDESVASEFRIQEQAYTRCLNLDEEPPFPQASAYFGTTPDEILGAMGGPLEEVAQGDASFDEMFGAAEEPVATIEPDAATEAVKPAPAEPAPEQTAARSSGGGSGKVERFSERWLAWCKEHYPNSFDPISGMVTPFGEKPRMCPAGS